LERIERGQRRGREDGDSIQNHPQPGRASHVARGIRRRWFRQFRRRR
jgi:hypothetical protein